MQQKEEKVVRVVSTPEGSAPFGIRQQLVGVELPVQGDSQHNAQHHYVSVPHLLNILLEHGKHEVVRFIEEHTLGVGEYPIPVAACVSR